MCMYCKPLLKAIDAYIEKADESLKDELKGAGYVKARQTVRDISDLEDEITDALKEETELFTDELEGADDLETFVKKGWPAVMAKDELEKTVYEHEFVARIEHFFIHSS